MIYGVHFEQGYGTEQETTGTGLVPFHVPLKPNIAEPPGLRFPLKVAFFTVIADPDVVNVPLHNWVMVCPAVNVHRTVQLVMAAWPAVTFTVALNPPGHWFTIV